MRVVLADAASRVLIAEAFMVRTHPQWAAVRELIAPALKKDIRDLKVWIESEDDLGATLEQQGIALENKWKANYSAFEFSEHLRKPADGGSERGLFFVTARGWDSEKKKASGCRRA